MSKTSGLFKTTAVATLVVIILGLLLTACSQGSDEDTAAQESKIDEIMKRGVLKVGLDIFVPGRSFDFWLKRESKG